MYFIAICDDDNEFREIICEEIKAALISLQKTYKIEVFSSGEELLKCVKCGKTYDMIFLDIVMGECSGFDVAQTVFQHTGGDNLIFVSSEEQYVFDTFEFRPFAFIKKTELSIRIEATIKRWIDNREDKYITFMYENIEKMVAYKELVYMESLQHYLYIYTKDVLYKIRGKITDYKYLCDNTDFFSPHMSYICNFEYVYDITKTNVILKDKTQIPISRGKSKEINEKYLKYIRSRI